MGVVKTISSQGAALVKRLTGSRNSLSLADLESMKAEADAAATAAETAVAAAETARRAALLGSDGELDKADAALEAARRDLDRARAVVEEIGNRIGAARLAEAEAVAEKHRRRLVDLSAALVRAGGTVDEAVQGLVDALERRRAILGELSDLMPERDLAGASLDVCAATLGRVHMALDANALSGLHLTVLHTDLHARVGACDAQMVAGFVRPGETSLGADQQAA